MLLKLRLVGREIGLGIRRIALGNDKLLMEEREFGANLERLLEKNNMKMIQLSKELGVGKSTVQEWVGKGGRFPNRPELIKKIADVFGVTTHELMFGVPDPNGLIGQILNRSHIHTGLYEISISKVDVKERGKI